jgi:hypothetical protein
MATRRFRVTWKTSERDTEYVQDFDLEVDGSSILAVPNMVTRQLAREIAVNQAVIVRVEELKA